MARTPPYETHFTVQATRARDGLGDRRRAAFDKGVALLAGDPFPTVSRPVGSTGAERTIRLTRDILVRYTVSRARLVILVVAVFHEEDVLVGNDKTTISFPHPPSSTRVGEYRIPSTT
ncbi:type II toxin-antitoxin system RelE family toxin [Streptomyces kebangsaanensis]|uniref:Type II toxin-antitoxin system RelE/ParE family toxin n=1 Tax=Streptomyces kebangsaanensis TaxID=864058 RepID=A0ABW6KQ66_9ACTN|nr:hypothetical protein [Streptomyces kebangsaanensis]